MQTIYFRIQPNSQPVCLERILYVRWKASGATSVKLEMNEHAISMRITLKVYTHTHNTTTVQNSVSVCAAQKSRKTTLGCAAHCCSRQIIPNITQHYGYLLLIRHPQLFSNPVFLHVYSDKRETNARYSPQALILIEAIAGTLLMRGRFVVCIYSLRKFVHFITTRLVFQCALLVWVRVCIYGLQESLRTSSIINLNIYIHINI